MTPVTWCEPAYLYNEQEYARWSTERQLGMTPVIPLDDLEAWLKSEKYLQAPYAARNACIDALLAQVQAWRGYGNSKTK